jgi:mitochondrial fission protein ELM1
VIGTGRKTASIARWIGEQTQGRARLVQLGRKGADRVEPFDLTVSCAHFRLPSHPRRVDTVAPLTQVTPERLADAAARWQHLFAPGAKPRVALVIGGDTAQHRLDAATAKRIADEVTSWAHATGGSVFAITSPRTSAQALEAIAPTFGAQDHLHRWRPNETDNPYLGFLACADVLVVTGESESMLAEAVATGKPVYIYPLPEGSPSLRLRLSDWVTRRAYARPLKKKGTVRPQQGVEYLCARLIQRGLIRPPRDVSALHGALIHRGWARPFGAPLETGRRVSGSEVDDVAARVRALFGYAGASPAATEEGQVRRAATW